MSRDPALTPARVEALAAVDLRIVGVTPGVTSYAYDLPRVVGGSVTDFTRLRIATNELNAKRGDTLAVEPSGFRLPWAEDITPASILPATIPDTPVTKMSPELQGSIAAFLEKGRHKRRLTNVAYIAAHMVLQGVCVRRTGASREDWAALEDQLPEFVPADMQDDARHFYQSTKILAQLGDLAVDMRAAAIGRRHGNTRPILLSVSNRARASRVAERLKDKIAFTASM